jgi:ATP-binding cassette subfamily F protein uup
MRAERAARREQPGAMRVQVGAADPSGRLVFEAAEVSKSFDGVAVIDRFSARIMRGDRIGLIGPNGAGKTTLLRLLLGETAPDSGEVRTGANVQVAYYDQQREQLDPEATVFDTVGEGNSTVTINGRPRHVNGYLADFLFPPERSRSPVKALSGGERNRLLLARLFTRPANVLVLDEPTNDLDLESLELLEAQLAEFPGTLLLVSHDREFLDNAVTSTLVFEGGGRVQEYVGGYRDWLKQRAAAREAAAQPSSAPPPGSRQQPRAGGPAGSDGRRETGSRKRLTFKEQREFTALPGRIDSLEAELRRLEATIAGPEFYKEEAAEIARALARAEEARRELDEAYARWIDLEPRSG